MKVIRFNDVAKRLGISRTTLWRWRRQGRVPPSRQLGPNVVGWTEDEIDTWLESRPKVGQQNHLISEC